MDDKQIQALAQEASEKYCREATAWKHPENATSLTPYVADAIRTALLEAGEQLCSEAYLDAQAAQKAAGANWVAIEKAIDELSKMKPNPPTGFVQVPLHVIRSCEKAIEAACSLEKS